jgi:hypothetical protein
LLQIESYSKETQFQVSKPIYLSLPEMVRLSMLMTTASQFWTTTFDRTSEEDLDKIDKFCEEWKEIRKSIDAIFEKVSFQDKFLLHLRLLEYSGRRNGKNQ